MSKANVPWYKWRFTLGGVWVTLLFLYLAWEAISDVEAPTALRICATMFFLALATLFVALEWRNRKPVTFTLRKGEESEET